MSKNHQRLLGLLLALFAAVLPQLLSAQTLRGVATDAISGEALIGATVKLVEADKGAVTDIDGNYRIEVGLDLFMQPTSYPRLS